jgi:hypothetical protein
MLSRLINLLIVIFSIIAGITVGSLYFWGLLPLVIFGVAAALGITIISLILVIVLISIIYKYCSESVHDCLNSYGILLLVGILGTIITTLIILSVIITPLNFIASTLVGFATFFFLLEILSLVFTLFCSFKCSRIYAK